MPARPVALLLLGLCLAGAASGCAASRTPAPNLTRPVAPGASVPRDFPSLGLGFRSAGNWSYDPGQPPLVALMTSGQALLAIWRYPRTEPLPVGLAALRQARHALVAAAQARDATFVAEQNRIFRLDGQPAIELLGRETVAGQPRRLRSVHVYAHGAEFVIDALAPAGYFPGVDADEFVPFLDTLRFLAPLPATPPRG